MSRESTMKMKGVVEKSMRIGIFGFITL